MNIIDMQEEKKRLITEARQLYVALPILEPMLEKKKDFAFKKLMSSFRDGQHGSFLTLIAELYTIDMLQNEIKTKIQNLKLGE